jgi:large conductance mechanosensitive channel
MLKEFKTFALKGNVLDLAIAVVIGGAFSKIVASLVNDLIMPILGVLIGGVNFASKKIMLHEATADGTLELSIKYGLFIEAIISFLIISFSLFIFIKVITSMKKKEIKQVIAPKPSNEELLLTEIRDLLKEK